MLALRVTDLYEILFHDLDLLARCLVLYCIVGLRDQLVHIKVVLIKREIHRLELGEVEQVVYEGQQHVGLV